MVARMPSGVNPAAVRLALTRSQSCSKRRCSGRRMRPSPKRRTAKGAPIPNPRSSRNCLGTVSCPFSPILVVVMYSRGVLWVDIVGKKILPQSPSATKHEVRARHYPEQNECDRSRCPPFGRSKRLPGTLTRIMHVSEDKGSLICYKHVVETVFEAANEASKCLTIAQHSVCCSQEFVASL